MMSSKVALEKLVRKLYNSNDICISLSAEDYMLVEAIMQDLDRLEKVEKENQELVVNKNVAQGIAIRLKEENDKLKKALEILKDKLNIDISTNGNVDNYYKYYLDFQNSTNTRTLVPITQEQYGLLKEVLGNANINRRS